MKDTRLWRAAMLCLAAAFGLTGSSLAQEQADEGLVQLVINLLGDQDKDVRALGFEQVRTAAKGQAATKQFAALLPKLSPEAQVGLISALADRGDSAARPAVLEVLADTSEQSVRVSAIEALGALGQESDLPRLVQLLAEASTAEKAAARKSLIRLRGETVPAALARAMTQAPPPLRVAMIEILATRRALDAIPALLAEAIDADAAVRSAAMSALGQLAGPEHLPGMVRGVLRTQSSRERADAEKAVMFVCGRIPDAEKRADPLLAAMDQLRPADRAAMLSTLGRVGGPPARKIVETVIADSDPRMQELGLRAICNWPDASIAPRLIELATTSKRPEQRTMALRALIRVAPLPDERPDAERLALLRKAMSMCTRDTERNLVLQRARAIRTLEALRFLTPYIDQPAFAPQACLSVVELAHHRELRDANKAEFHQALDKVILTSKDATVIDRAKRYKKGQTWVRPTAP